MVRRAADWLGSLSCIPVWAEWRMMSNVVQAEYERDREAWEATVAIKPDMLTAPTALYPDLLYPYTPIPLYPCSHTRILLHPYSLIYPCTHISVYSSIPIPLYP